MRFKGARVKYIGVTDRTEVLCCSPAEGSPEVQRSRLLGSWPGMHWKVMEAVWGSRDLLTTEAHTHLLQHRTDLFRWKAFIWRLTTQKRNKKDRRAEFYLMEPETVWGTSMSRTRCDSRKKPRARGWRSSQCFRSTQRWRYETEPDQQQKEAGIYSRLPSVSSKFSAASAIMKHWDRVLVPSVCWSDRVEHSSMSQKQQADTNTNYTMNPHRQQRL